jgi:hypothetical protein
VIVAQPGSAQPAAARVTPDVGPLKLAKEGPTGPDPGKPVKDVITDFGAGKPAQRSPLTPANWVGTGADHRRWARKNQTSKTSGAGVFFRWAQHKE